MNAGPIAAIAAELGVELAKQAVPLTRALIAARMRKFADRIERGEVVSDDILGEGGALDKATDAIRDLREGD